jgi:hypothetical protein
MNQRSSGEGNEALSCTLDSQRIHSRQDLVDFIRALRSDCSTRPGWWENHDLGSFLDALADWTEDMEGYYRNRGEPVPTCPSWRTLGEMLMAAAVYE